MVKKKETILIAEDEKFLVRVYAYELEEAGYRVVIATDGVEAIEKIRKEKPDAIFLDLILPKKGGFEVLEELKADKKLKKIPVMILSNLGQESDMKRGRELGADDYLIKADWSLDDIIKKLRALLDKKA